ncbi:metabolite traffic protein EboE [Rufibacter tibetensis]|uniref:Xylose isomerase n=1 Tax=Rufibacter tibetensis TaxID=512763 RepID=A0A0P0C7F0_9BACT|nr:metabolite traffic protein EboE [Rufibacter tibetensis]ALJ00994.1 xylose isomerase [Rufibacter tibetensis]
MRVNDHLHLSYCTNIHPGETWEDVFSNLREYLPTLKNNLSPDKPFGIGLRLSDLASRELAQQHILADFQEWLEKHGLYVYTMNGFPYGGFHNQVVKDGVHKPDWTTNARLEYTKRLAHILATLLPEGLEGGISTSPLSYKPWHPSQAETDTVFASATANLLELVDSLLHIRKQTGKTIHIDLEPEPDGLLENSEEIIRYFQNWLLPKGIKRLSEDHSYSPTMAKETILNHMQVCYDVCHFALAFEQPEEAFAKLTSAGIKIGKIQLSAALKVRLPSDATGRAALKETLSPFAESTYLHQVVAKNHDGTLTHYTDLDLALDAIQETNAQEWRTHFHVPLFTDTYNGLQSTQEDIQQVLALLNKQHITHHLEVETYTWEVLPEGLKTDLAHSIQRELEWVIETITENQHAKNGGHQRGGAHPIAHR